MYFDFTQNESDKETSVLRVILIDLLSRLFRMYGFIEDFLERSIEIYFFRFRSAASSRSIINFGEDFRVIFGGG